MSNFDCNKPLFTELTVEQAATVEGGFFKKIIQKQKQLPKIAKPLMRKLFPPTEPITVRPIGAGLLDDLQP
jgi:hypothetical protein